MPSTGAGYVMTEIMYISPSCEQTSRDRTPSPRGTWVELLCLPSDTSGVKQSVLEDLVYMNDTSDPERTQGLQDLCQAGTQSIRS